MEWRVTISIALAVSSISSFVPISFAIVLHEVKRPMNLNVLMLHSFL
jgi:hypothetical protein